MDFSLTEEQKMLQTTVRDFAREKVEPIADQMEQAEEFPWGNFKLMGKLGLFGLLHPPEYGGGGSDHISFVIATEELARACASTADVMLAQNACMGRIYREGTEEQRMKYLPPLIQGEKVGADALTEAEAGSDIGNMQATAVRDGNHYIINGTKIFITNAPVSDVVTFCATLPGQGKRGITGFIVEEGTPGFKKGVKYNKVGLRSAVTGELVFEDCRIPVSNRLGEEGQGFKAILTNIDYTRIGISAQALGIARAVLEGSIEYSKQRVQFGRPICENQAIQWMLADMATELEQARLLTYEAAYLADQGMPFTKIVAMAKLSASELCMKAAVQGVQIFGGYGYMMDSPMQRYFRDAKITTIYEGTSEIQRLVIARHLLR